MTRAAPLLACLVLGGCLSVGDSEPAAEWTLDLPAATAGFPVRVFLPAGLRAPSVITQEPGDAPVTHPLDRWSTPLTAQLAKVIGAELAGLPLRSATVTFRRLEAGREGALRAEASVEFQLSATPAPIVLELSHAGSTEMEHTSLGNAVEAYQGAAKAIGKGVRARVEAELGEVAKPAGDVTVPAR